jgi:hypothetical protein
VRINETYQARIHNAENPFTSWLISPPPTFSKCSLNHQCSPYYIQFTCGNSTFSASLNRVVPITVAERSKGELPSVTRTLALWVRISLKAWISMCEFILCLCSPVCRQRPCDRLITRPRSLYTLCKNDYETEEAMAQQRAVEPLMKEIRHELDKWIFKHP